MEDPTVVMVNNLEYSGADFGVGFVLLISAAVIEFVARLVHAIDDMNPDTRIQKVVRTPLENFDIARKMGYNYKSNFITLMTIPRIHYLDEGDKESNHIILLLHGEPFWSYCWVNVIPHFTKRGYRVIAPDFVGFGMSDKPVNWRSYSLQLHKDSVSNLLDYLSLLNSNKTVTLVGHNWGWMVGAAVAKDFPKAFDRLVILNTNNMPDGELSPGRYPSTSTWLKFMTSNAFFLAFRASVNLLRTWFPLSILIHSLNPGGYGKEEVEAMLCPHPVDSEYRGGTTAFPLMVPVSSSDRYAAEFSQIRYFLSQWNKPTLILYSGTALVPWLQEGDFVVGNRAVFYSKLIPGAVPYRRIANAGHLLMYDQPMAVAHNILEFLETF